ncbi:MAG TPA: PKD domain-containing protein [Thermoplasmata archaeon]|nr:PKD domain-containing protein [Thermoplasmata archaeon]
MTRRPWGKIAAVVLVVLLILAAAALFVRRPNRSPTIVQTTWSPAVPVVGNSVTFTAAATDPDGDDLSLLWDFGDGSFGTGAESPHAYAIPGLFTAYVTASDGKGGLATSEANLLRLGVGSGVIPRTSCPSPATCTAGAVAAVLDVDRWVAAPGVPIAFFGNLSWAYKFSWNNITDHSKGGTYTRDVAWQNATLFDRFQYVWGDGTANTTGTTDFVGNTTHAFGRAGMFLVRLTVTYRDAVLNTTTNQTTGVTIRIG